MLKSTDLALRQVPMVAFELVNHYNGGISVVSYDTSIYKFRLMKDDGTDGFPTVTPYTGYLRLYGNLGKVYRLNVDCGFTNVSGTYYFSGIKLKADVFMKFPNLKELYIRNQTNQFVHANNVFELSGDFAKFPDSLEYYYFLEASTLYGSATFNLNNVSSTSTLKLLTISDANSPLVISGNISYLPTTLTNLKILKSNNNTVSGDLSNLKSKSIITEFDVRGFNTITNSTSPDFPQLLTLIVNGNNTISKLPTAALLNTLEIQGNNTISEIPAYQNILTINIAGKNTISSVPSLPTCTSITISGNNTVSSMGSLPAIKSITLYGNATIGGTFGYSTLTSLVLSGVNTVSALSSMPLLTYLLVAGNNTISSIPEALELTYLYITGKNTISALPSLPNVGTLYIEGYNTISALPELPKCTTLRVLGNNVLTDIPTLPKCVNFTVGGSNKLTGDIFTKLPLVQAFNIGGNNTITYSTSVTFPSTMQSVQIIGSALTSTMVDNLLIDLAKVTTWTGAKTVTIKGNSGARTSASDAAVATLVGKGVAVSTN